MKRGRTNSKIPVGTQVVLLAAPSAASQEFALPGMVGEIVAAPESFHGRYRVRLPGGLEVSLGRDELDPRKDIRKGVFSTTSNVLDLSPFIEYRCVVGSRAYGLDNDRSDTDRRGFYLAPAELEWSFGGAPEQLENQLSQECYWELRKFLVLALRANPNVLECLYTPVVEYASPLAKELLQNRSAFLSKLVYQTYSGYVMSQFKKLNRDLKNKGSFRWKHPMHLIRLLLSGIEILERGFVPVRIEEHRDALLEIRNGRWRWSRVNAWRLELHEKFDRAYQATRLPDTADFSWANRFLIRARKAMALRDK